MALRALRDRFAAIRAATRALAAPLSAEDCQVQSMPDASPVKWHLGHTTWFFEAFVLERPGGPSGYLFNSYYESLGDRLPRPRRGLMTRPSLAEVLDYRARVDEEVLGRLDALEPAMVETGLQHEQQHQELILTDIKHLLALQQGPGNRGRGTGSIPPFPPDPSRTRPLGGAGGTSPAPGPGSRGVSSRSATRAPGSRSTTRGRGTGSSWSRSGWLRD